MDIGAHANVALISISPKDARLLVLKVGQDAWINVETGTEQQAAADAASAAEVPPEAMAAE